MFNFLLVLILIAAVLLIIIVLAQNPKGGGLAQGFTGGSQVVDVQRTNKFLNNSTWTLVAVIVFLSILTASVNKSNDNEQQSIAIKEVQAPMAEQPISSIPTNNEVAE